ncbi:MAG: hypothetical protein E7187_07005 [Erysipelotrichaceae bacterium]|nr:hypothetical protein [Erysipelotrichaceae bacterium]
MVDLIEILIGVFVTASICYARYFYGTRAVVELIVVLAAAFALAAFLITEIMKSVCQKEMEDENDGEGFTRRRSSSGVIRKLIAYHVLEKSTNAFDRIVGWCSETLEIDDEGENLYE